MTTNEVKAEQNSKPGCFVFHILTFEIKNPSARGGKGFGNRVYGAITRLR